MKQFTSFLTLILCLLLSGCTAVAKSTVEPPLHAYHEPSLAGPRGWLTVG